MTINGLKIGEIGLELALFMDAKLLAAIGEQAAADEAHALCPNVAGAPVESFERDWFPPSSETHSIIREKVLEALRRREEMTGLHLDPLFRFTLEPTDGFFFDREKRAAMRWPARRILLSRCKGRMSGSQTSWQAKTVIGGLHALHSARPSLARRR